MEQRVNQRVATQIVRRVSELGIDNATLADRLEMSEATLVRRLTSKSSFTVTELARAASFMDCSLADLIPITEGGVDSAAHQAAPKSVAS